MGGPLGGGPRSSSRMTNVDRPVAGRLTGRFPAGFEAAWAVSRNRPIPGRPQSWILLCHEALS